MSIDLNSQIASFGDLSTTALTSNRIRFSSNCSVTGIIPPGSIVMYAGNSASSLSGSGWLLCDGSTYNISDYLNLYNIIGNTYGGTAGSTFKVPNMIEKFPRGIVSTSVGNSGGSANITLSANNLPAHSHTVNNIQLASHSHSINWSDLTTPIINSSTTQNVSTASNIKRLVNEVTANLYNQLATGVPNTEDATWTFYGQTSTFGNGATPININNPYIDIAFIIKI